MAFYKFHLIAFEGVVIRKIGYKPIINLLMNNDYHHKIKKIGEHYEKDCC